MSDFVLPKEVQYITPAALPECQNQQVVLSPINSTSLGPSSLLQFDLPSRGYMIPETCYIRYKATITNTGTANYTGTLRGLPLYSFFSKLETIIGSSSAESIQNYNQICHMWMNCQMDIAEKYGNQYSLGLDDGSTSLAAQDGRSFNTPATRVASGGGTKSFTVSGFLPFCLSNAEKLVPLHMMPGVRVQLTTVPISDIFTAVADTILTYKLENVELVYDMVNFTNEVDDMIRSMGEKFYLKTHSYVNMGAPVAKFIGNTELIFNTRLASIKSLFTIFNPTYAATTGGAYTANGLFDSVDITSEKGSYQYTVAATQYPMRELSTLNNKSAILTELRKALGSMSVNSYNTSINIREFSITDATFNDNTLPPTTTEPGKFYLGVNLEKIHTSALLTGISTQNSPISLRINCSEETKGNFTVYLIALFDQLIIIDPINRDVVVKQ